jgi:predicted Zn-ribbon and HTH transcriptional regulator
MLATKKFQRNIEDFRCENCGYLVKGNGYTNHCPVCLWSKHVDKNPGDREEDCKGMMEPADLVQKESVFYIIHRCTKCGFTRNNKAEKGDSFNELIKISNKKA